MVSGDSVLSLQRWGVGGKRIHFDQDVIHEDIFINITDKVRISNSRSFVVVLYWGGGGDRQEDYMSPQKSKFF